MSDKPAAYQLKYKPKIKEPVIAAMKAKVVASCTLILPLATGLVPVRFITASVSFSAIWFIALALPVTSIPPNNNNKMLPKSYSTTLGASMYAITLLNTTVKLSVNLMSCL